METLKKHPIMTLTLALLAVFLHVLTAYTFTRALFEEAPLKPRAWVASGPVLGKRAPVDTDADGVQNTADPDIDGDGILNGEDPNVDGAIVLKFGTLSVQVGDSLYNGDPKELDIDGDGLLDADSQELDIDGDGLADGDPWELDIDGDASPDELDQDIDGDNAANRVDPDADGDGLTNVADNAPIGVSNQGLDCRRPPFSPPWPLPSRGLGSVLAGTVLYVMTHSPRWDIT